MNEIMFHDSETYKVGDTTKTSKFKNKLQTLNNGLCNKLNTKHGNICKLCETKNIQYNLTTLFIT